MQFGDSSNFLTKLPFSFLKKFIVNKTTATYMLR